MKREQMFIQLLEGLHPDEADVIIKAKDKELGKRYKVTKSSLSLRHFLRFSGVDALESITYRLRSCTRSGQVLPYTAYLVEYLQDGMTHFDIVIGRNQVEIFDHYYDNYKQDFVNMTQTEGES